MSVTTRENIFPITQSTAVVVLIGGRSSWLWGALAWILDDGRLTFCAAEAGSYYYHTPPLSKRTEKECSDDYVDVRKFGVESQRAIHTNNRTSHQTTTDKSTPCAILLQPTKEKSFFGEARVRRCLVWPRNCSQGSEEGLQPVQLQDNLIVSTSSEACSSRERLMMFTVNDSLWSRPNIRAIVKYVSRTLGACTDVIRSLISRQFAFTAGVGKKRQNWPHPETFRSIGSNVKVVSADYPSLSSRVLICFPRLEQIVYDHSASVKGGFWQALTMKMYNPEYSIFDLPRD
ncbi:hypothetical protein BaRGS_00001426 [Batillaria attramentaria]|uniref:Uncharacterized protein n=1 Tax=Batillaria attramentaria TaxID=370345 RepID=A0ABD0M755_9CAEN